MNMPKTRIMIIGEDLSLLRALAFTLKRHDYVVDISLNPRETAKALRSGNPVGLVITDILHPGISEHGIIEVLRELPPEMPVLVITSCRSAGLSRALEQPRIGEVLIKPFNSDELVSRISSLLERPNEQSPGEERA